MTSKEETKARNVKKRRAALRRKATRGNAEAMYELAIMADLRSLNPRFYLINVRWSLYWGERADRAGFAWAATHLGHLYSYSYPNNPLFDLKKALFYYQRAASLGHEYAKEMVAKTIRRTKTRQRKAATKTSKLRI